MAEVIIRTKRVLKVCDGKLVLIRPSKEVPRPSRCSVSRERDEGEEMILPSTHVVAANFSRRAASRLAGGLSAHQLRGLRGRARG